MGGNTDTDFLRVASVSGVKAGLSLGMQQWINGFLFWAGGYLLFKHPRLYDFRDFMIQCLACSSDCLDLDSLFRTLPTGRKPRRVRAEFFISWIERVKSTPSAMKEK